MRRGLQFALVSAVLVFGAAWGITVLKPDVDTARAVWSSAAIAFVVQLLTFVIAQSLVAANAVAAWGLGSLIRFAVVVLYAIAGIPALGLASGPALLSLVGFLFVTMVVEPLFLNR